ncbi:unnamed protein product [Urochloa humidicola]
MCARCAAEHRLLRHGLRGVVVSSPSPKMEEFLGRGSAMSLSLDNSYSGAGGHGHVHGQDQTAYLQPLQ